MKREGTPRFVPMPGKIVVQVVTDEMVGSLYLPPSTQRSRVMGTILALGDDEEEGDIFFPLRVGDTVLFGQNSGVAVRVDREEVLILRTSEVLCTLVWEDTDGSDS